MAELEEKVSTNKAKGYSWCDQLIQLGVDRKGSLVMARCPGPDRCLVKTFNNLGISAVILRDADTWTQCDLTEDFNSVVIIASPHDVIKAH